MYILYPSKLVYPTRLFYFDLFAVPLDDTTPEERPGDLVRNCDGDAEVLCERPYCARVLLEPAAYQDCIGVTVVQYALGDVSVCDGADDCDDELVPDGLLDCSGERGVVRLRPGWGKDLLRVVSGGRHVYHVDATLRKKMCEADGIFYRP